MSYKFIFDTNILNNELTKKLVEGGLVSACESGRFAFYATPILLTERLHFVANGKIPVGAITSLKLLADLKWQKLFNEPGGPDGIYTGELENKLQSNYLFSNYQSIKENLALISSGGEFSNETKQTLRDYFEQWKAKKNNNRIGYKLRREDVIKELQKNKSLSRKDSDFKSFLNLRFEQAAIDKIRTIPLSTIPFS